MTITFERGVLIPASVIVVLLAIPLHAFASGAIWTNRTTGTGASGLGWDSLTSSSDGTILAATEYTFDDNYNIISPSDIWVSTTSGATWTNVTTGTAASTQAWDMITSSSDGTKLAMVIDGTDIWTSTTTAATSTNVTEGIGLSGKNWRTISSSSDGNTLVASEYTGDIWVSTTTGATWVNRTTGNANMSGNGWNSPIAISSDGTKLAAVEKFNSSYGADYIYTSTNTGATWTQRTGAGQHGWGGIASSADGTKLVAVAEFYDGNDDAGDYVYTSADGGATWTQQTAAGLRYWGNVAMSADGTKIFAQAFHDASNNPDYLYVSSDGGVTWTAQTGLGLHSGGSVALSADGTKVAWSLYHGDIYTATFSAPTLTTEAATSLSTTGATLNGTITASGGTDPTVRGFVYGSDTTYGATTTELGSFDTGSFTADLSSLSCGATYHYASYATSGYGTGYGSDQSFTTSACPIPAGGGGIVGSGPNAPSYTGPAGHAVIPGEPLTTESPSTPATPNLFILPPLPATLSPTQTQVYISLYTSLLQILEQELAALKAALGK